MYHFLSRYHLKNTLQGNVEGFTRMPFQNPVIDFSFRLILYSRKWLPLYSISKAPTRYATTARIPELTANLSSNMRRPSSIPLLKTCFRKRLRCLYDDGWQLKEIVDYCSTGGEMNSIGIFVKIQFVTFQDPGLAYWRRRKMNTKANSFPFDYLLLCAAKMITLWYSNFEADVILQMSPELWNMNFGIQILF